MASPAPRALLFLDVDGTLLPLGAPPSTPTGTGSELPSVELAGANPLLARLDPRHGPRLMSLGCDVVWATTWMEEANEVIAPLLGLPALQLVEWPESDEDGPLHWKTRALVKWAAGRSFVWVDDEISAVDGAWVSTHHPGMALLHRVDSRLGITDDDYAAIGEWLARL